MSELRCPTCRVTFKQQDSPAMPFCSKRCKLIDLGRWLNEEQSVPHEPDEDELMEMDLFTSDENDANDSY